MIVFVISIVKEMKMQVILFVWLFILSNSIEICVKNISSSKYSSIRLTCWSILQILFKNYYSSCISIVDDILSLISNIFSLATSICFLLSAEPTNTVSVSSAIF